MNDIIFYGAGIEFEYHSADLPVFPESTIIRGTGIEYVLNEEEKIVLETTRIQGFAIEIVDFPIYSFAIQEDRL